MQSTPNPVEMQFVVSATTADPLGASIYFIRAVLLPNYKLRVVLACRNKGSVMPAITNPPLKEVCKLSTIQISAENKRKITGFEFTVMGSEPIYEISDAQGLKYFQKQPAGGCLVPHLTLLGRKIYTPECEPEGTIVLSEEDNAAYMDYLVSKWASDLSQEHYFTMFKESQNFPGEEILFDKTFKKELDKRKHPQKAQVVQEPEPVIPEPTIPKPTPISASPASFWNRNKWLIAAGVTAAAALVLTQ